MSGSNLGNEGGGYSGIYEVCIQGHAAQMGYFSKNILRGGLVSSKNHYTLILHFV